MKNKKGFTLVEVIVSIAALGIICAVLLRLFVVAGKTNNKAVDMQTAGICVTSVVETLAGADTVEQGLLTLGIELPDSMSSGEFSLIREGFEIKIGLEQRGDYPGALYDISVSALSGDAALSSVQTSKYYKEAADD